MDNAGVIDRIGFVLDKRGMTHAHLSELLEEAGRDVPHGAGTVSRYLRGDGSPRLNWILAVADVLNLDYRWLLSGDRNGWDGMPKETVRLLNSEGETEMEFEIPEGWPDLNLRIYPGVGKPRYIEVQRKGDER